MNLPPRPTVAAATSPGLALGVGGDSVPPLTLPARVAATGGVTAALVVPVALGCTAVATLAALLI